MEPPGPKVKALMEKHGSRLPRYTQPITGGQRIFIKNPDGNIFLDLISGRCVTDIGYSNPKLVEALQTQVAKGTCALACCYIAPFYIIITPSPLIDRSI